MHPAKVLPFLYTHARDNGENSHTRRKRIYECRIMIRANSVLSKLILLHTPDPELLALAEEALETDRICCPDCGTKGSSRRINSYRRMLITVREGKREEALVRISRVQCLACKKTPTHALLPDVLIPHRSYSLRFILHVLRAYLTRPGTVRELCEEWQIAVSTLYEWIHLFVDQYNLWCKVLDRISWVCKQALDRILSFPAFPSAFFNTFRFSFLQRQKPTQSPPVVGSG